ncbi:MAG: tRNA preQ1(34) S-adenosylmethionine ribosyltransferase-isomerase QueA [Bacteroides sp.]|nr:tRNA preQ1(34) S-adenosylmethionine ribosyltransferase-isomerase QueA [Bacteroidales bacterium]MBD5316413.1 tRNA preQ1(34) S-adenosylmethionine ribosyltransferase-isomerase QueA [Bacteroides sp.]
MKLSQFKFNLPEELIAQHPAERRDESRMMVVDRKTGEISHHIFKEIINYFDDGDIFVFNDTMIFPARLYGNKEKTGARIEVFLLRELNAEHKLWDVLVEPARKIRIGNKLYFGDDESMVAEVIDNTTSRGRTLRFLYDGPHDEFKEALFKLGQTPLPAYITREPTADDAERYQTIFAAKEGAVVAPAAGLHFSRELLKRLEIKGIKQEYLTVHSGLGNYREIDVEDLTKHRMDSEEIDVTPRLVEAVNDAKDNGHKVCAVGTSVLRGIATAVSMGGHMKTYTGWTNKFIFPPYEFTVTNALVSNFHLPQSTMLMMVAAFGGYDLIMKAYETAVKEGYRFGVYGDAMLVI